LQVILSVKCLLCVCGMMTSIVVIWRGGLSWLGFRPLTRSIFIGHVISALLCSLLFAFCYAYDVYRLSQDHDDPCDYTLDMRFAFFMRIIPVFGMFGSIYFMIALAIERSIATCSPTVYDFLSSKKLATFIAVQIVIFFSLFVPVIFLIPPIDWEQRMYVFNTRTDENDDAFR
ncbi:hypothetical protein PFISCL1PPCAC_16572, partial [Pristionchus fissidentatus]